MCKTTGEEIAPLRLTGKPTNITATTRVALTSTSVQTLAERRCVQFIGGIEMLKYMIGISLTLDLSGGLWKLRVPYESTA